MAWLTMRWMLILRWSNLALLAAATAALAADPAYDDLPGDIFDRPAASQGGDSAPPADAAAVDVERHVRDRRVWPQLWRRYAALYIHFEGRYLPITRFQPACPSSRGMTVDGFIQEQTELMRVQVASNMQRTIRVAPSRDEAVAYANALPKLAVGEYGRVHVCRIEKVLGPDQMIVCDLQLIDPDQLSRDMESLYNDARKRMDDDRAARQYVDDRFAFRLQLLEQQRDPSFRQRIRLAGFDTSSLIEGHRWHGPADLGIRLFIVGVGLDVPPTDPAQNVDADAARSDRRQFSRRRSRTERVFVAIPLDRLPAPLTEAQFLDMLSARQTSQSDFIDLVFQQTDRSTRDVEQRVIAELESRLPEGP